MPRIYIFLVVCFFAASVAMVFKFGVHPRAVSILKPSYFNSPEEVGALVLRRFYSEMGSEKLVVFGIPSRPPFYEKVVEGFLKAAAQEHRDFDVLLLDARVPKPALAASTTLEVKPFDMLNAFQPENLKVLQDLLGQGKRVFILTLSAYSTHLLGGNPIIRLEAALGFPVFTFTAQGVALKRELEYLVDPPCVGVGRDTHGTAGLGCTILQTGRLYYRKNLDLTRFVALMDQQGRSDYLLLISAPNGLEKLTGAHPFATPPPAAVPGIISTESMVEEAAGRGSKDQSGYYDGGEYARPHKPDLAAPGESDPNSALEEDVN